MTKTTTMTMVAKQAAAMQPDAQYITSLEIAEVTGKLHKVVLKAIREMEPAWHQECGHNFVLTSQPIEMPQGGVRMTPVFSLTKTESLFVATKFNDTARARLVMRWEELERERLAAAMHTASPFMMLETEEELLRRSDAIRRRQIEDANAPSSVCMTASCVAEMLDISVRELNRRLVDEGVQFKNGRHYVLTPAYQGHGLARERTFHYFTLDGEKRECPYLVWTPEGRDFILSIFNK